VIFYHLFMYHIVSLHGVVALLDFCRRYGVHYRLLSSCVGSFACPGIDTPVQGTTVWSPLQATVHLCGIICLPWHRYSGTMDHSMKSATGYCPPVWGLACPGIDTQVQGTTVCPVIDTQQGFCPGLLECHFFNQIKANNAILHYFMVSGWVVAFLLSGQCRPAGAEHCSGTRDNHLTDPLFLYS
jgi:hypothetical protein